MCDTHTRVKHTVSHRTKCRQNYIIMFIFVSLCIVKKILVSDHVYSDHLGPEVV